MRLKGVCIYIDEDIKYRQFYLYKFCHISVNFDDTKMVGLILKISKPGVIDIRSVLCKLEYCNYCVHEKMSHGSLFNSHVYCTLKLKMNRNGK